MAASMTDRPLPTGEGLTFEKVWAMFQENARQMAETDRRMQETDRQMQETDRRIKETERIVRETDRQMQETDRQIKRLNKQMGDLHNSFGEMAEHLVVPSIEKRFNELGYHFNAASPGGYVVLNDDGKIAAQVDILLENTGYIMAVEVKAKVHMKDIEHHEKRLQILRKHWDKRGDKRVIRGAVAGAMFGSIEKKAAIDAGFYVLVQSGDTMKLELPEGFVPGAW